MMAEANDDALTEASYGGYIESMHIDDELTALVTKWKKWKAGPETKSSDVPRAKSDLIAYITKHIS